jgi:hypothetical protein
MRHVVQLALAVLLLAPLATGAHVHGAGADLSPACGVCTVAKHAPAVVGAGTPTLATAYVALPALTAPLAPACAERCRHPAGRAPPPASRQTT